MKFNNKQSGFTLVEIAIVLVVIGLLLGGILKGQQLINSARVRNLADQNSGVQAAYYGFIDRFRNLPGDMTCVAAVANVGSAVTAAGCATDDVGGDANGRIDGILEIGAVWAHLSIAQFLNGTFDGLDAGDNVLTAVTYKTAVAGGGIPPNAFQGPIMIAHSNDYITGNARDTVVRLAYSFGGNIPVPIIRDLDQKIDDGVAGTGVLRSAADLLMAGGGTFAGVTDYDKTGEDCLTILTDPSPWDVDSANQTCNALYLY